MSGKNRKRRIAAAFLLLILPLFGALAMILPAATGDNVKSDGNLTVDCSNASDGYIMIKGDESSKRYKLRIVYDETTFTYDINSDGEYEVFPLQMGSGKYSIKLYRNTEGKKYSEQGEVSVKAELYREDAAFLCPNVFVNYTDSTPCVQKAIELTDGMTSEKDKYTAIEDFVKKNFVYDFVRSVTVEPNTMPDIERTFETHMGICQDLSSMMVAMLRAVGVPATIQIGYADGNYHAWLTAYPDGEEIFFDPTVALSGMNKVKEYELERFY